MEETFTYGNYVQDPLRYTDPTGERAYGPSWYELLGAAESYMMQERRRMFNMGMTHIYGHSNDATDLFNSICTWGDNEPANGDGGHDNSGTGNGENGGINLSRLSESQRKSFCEANNLICDLSALYNNVFNALDACDVDIYIEIDNTMDEEGAFDKNGNAIKFKNEESMNSFNVLIEEMFHAYQFVVNGDMYSSDEFNYEFEAKVAKYFIEQECNSPMGGYDGTGFEPMYDYLFRNNITTPVGCAFAFVYTQCAGNYAKFNNTYNYGDKRYKSGTMQSPYSLYKMFEIH